MKYCKLEIHKQRNASDTECSFAYPPGYDARLHSIISYENKAGSTEYAVSMVPDDFDFAPAGYTELTQVQAEALIADYVTNDKDFNDFDSTKHATLLEAKTAFITKRKTMGQELAAMARTCAEEKGERTKPNTPTWS